MLQLQRARRSWGSLRLVLKGLITCGGVHWKGSGRTRTSRVAVPLIGDGCFDCGIFKVH